MNLSDILLIASLGIVGLAALITLLVMSIELLVDQYYGKGLFGLALFLAFLAFTISVALKVFGA